jgi:spermidine/putrescine transport system ATP-binding protein
VTALIQLRGVHKYYGDYHALRGIDLEIRQGEFFSLLGPSGCGKTTLLRTIAGFESVSEGTLQIDGRDMAGVPANERPTNMVFQSYAIFPHLTVAENVGFGLRRRRRPVRWLVRSRWWGWAALAGGRRMRCRAGSGSGWRWRGR